MYPKTLRHMHACPYVYIRYCTLCTYQPPLPAPKKREKSLLLHTCNLGLGLGVLQEPGVQPQPIPQPSPHTHTHTHTRGNKKLNSTFHFPLSLLLPVLTYYRVQVCILSTVVKNPKYAWTIHTTLPYLPPLIIDYHYRQYVRNLRNCRAESCKSVYHQTHIRVRRGVPFPMYM